MKRMIRENFKQKFPLVLLLICCIAYKVDGQKLSVKFNLSNAEKTLDILKSETVNEASYKALVAMESTQGLIKKLYTSDSLLINALKQVRLPNQGHKSSTRFQYDFILNNIDSLTAFISYLKNNEQQISDRLNKALSKYVDADKRVEVEVIGLLGGNATGYTFGDKDKFYLSLHHMNNDADYLMAFSHHELFHNLQAALFDTDTLLDNLKGENTKNKNYIVYYLVNSLFNEGTATYLDNWESKPLTSANKAIKERNTKNAARLNFVNYMFDRHIVDLAATPTLEGLNAVYNIFFTTNFDEAGYYLGKELTKYALDRGNRDLNYYLRQPATVLLLDYFKLSENDPNAPLEFSKSFISTITDLHKVVMLHL